MSDGPNIVMIVAHDLGTHLGCYGAGLETPHIDELAREGVLFTDLADKIYTEEELDELFAEAEESDDSEEETK